MTFIKEKLLKIIICVTIVFTLLVVATTIMFYYNQDAAKELIMSFLEANADMINSEGNILMTSLIMNNITASLISVIMGVVPFLFIPLFSLVVNSIMIGAALGFSSITTSTSAFKIFIVGMMPHGIFELPALLISMSMGIYLCYKISKKIVKSDTESLIDVIKNIGKTFVFIVIPLLIIAGIIEAHLTPVIMNYFL